jgi:polyhydroxyalkanoate synthase
METKGDIREAPALGGFGVPAEALARLQADYLAGAMDVWNRVLQPGEAPSGAARDRRFAASEWSASPGSAYLAEMYLLNARTLLGMVDSLQADEKTRSRVRFAVLQWIDAASPSNFLALNPEAQKKAIETQGESLAEGMRHLWDDLQRGHLSQTDESAFEVGPQRRDDRRLGGVRERVLPAARVQAAHRQGLRAAAPDRAACINKFYILDLQPENSLIRHAVGEGTASSSSAGKNAGEEIAQRTWDDYIEHAAIKAIDLAREITGSEQVNTLGFCIGGTILACALAVLEGRGERRAASMTLLTSFLDFSDTGILDIFIDEGSVRMREMTIGAESAGGGSLLKGQELASTFSFLRPNDLVWNYVVGNYLKGETPPPFDLLYWNSDGTNLPGPMYCWYLRNTYLENKLKVPGAVTICGEKIDLGKISAPAYLYASREDHIVPWQGAYRSTSILKGKRRFVLGASGHIAGVINPPLKKKRSHWVGKTAALPESPEAGWPRRGASGSWWTDWSDWLRPFGGKQVAAPKVPGNRKWKAIEPAPGRYVKEKA